MRRRSTSIRTRIACATGCAAACLALGAGGCSGSRSYTRFTPDACASTLPTAGTAVHGRGRLTTIRPFHRAELKRYFGITPSPVPTPSPSPTAPGQPRACLVVFRGPFAAGTVTGAEQQAGRFALVLVRVRSPHVLRVRLSDTFPPPP
jgi:hypothetical protein